MYVTVQPAFQQDKHNRAAQDLEKFRPYQVHGHYQTHGHCAHPKIVGAELFVTKLDRYVRITTKTTCLNAALDPPTA
jgi:hypothetical protein